MSTVLTLVNFVWKITKLSIDQASAKTEFL